MLTRFEINYNKIFVLVNELGASREQQTNYQSTHVSRDEFWTVIFIRACLIGPNFSWTFFIFHLLACLIARIFPRICFPHHPMWLIFQDFCGIHFSKLIFFGNGNKLCRVWTWATEILKPYHHDWSNWYWDETRPKWLVQWNEISIMS